MKKYLLSLLFTAFAFCGFSQDIWVLGKDTLTTGAIDHLYRFPPTYYRHPLLALNDSTVIMDTANYYISTFAQNGTQDSVIVTFAGGRRLAAKAAGTSYTFSTGLTNTANTITNNLSTGIASLNQTLIGSNNAGGTLTILPTNNATLGTIIFGTLSAYTQANNRWGIGTTTPSWILHATETFAGGSRFFLQNLSSGTTSTTLIDLENNSSHALQMGMTSSGYTPTGIFTTDGAFIAASAGSMTIQTTASQPIIFGTGNQRVVTFSNTGTVGIGIAAPTAALHLPPGNFTTTGAGSAPLKFTASNVVTTTAASGTGTVATLTFASTTTPLYKVGSNVSISGVSPSGYNATTANVLSCTNTSITYSNATTGAQTVAGTITQGGLIPTPEAGGVEYDGTHFYGTSSTLVRQQLDNGPITITTGINAKSTGTTTIYTVPAGRTLIVTDCIVRVTAASSITVGLSASVTASTSGTIYASSAMTTLTATPQIFQFPTSGISVSASGGETIGFVIGTAATGTSQTVAVYLIGYLL